MEELEFHQEADGIIRVQNKDGMAVGTLVLDKHGNWAICLGMGKIIWIETFRKIIKFVDKQPSSGEGTDDIQGKPSLNDS